MSRAARCAPSRELNVAHFIRVGLGGLGPGARGAMRTSSPGSSSHDSGGVNREQRLPRPLCVRGSAGGGSASGLPSINLAPSDPLAIVILLHLTHTTRLQSPPDGRNGLSK